MSTDSDHAAAEKAAADKTIADEANASAAATTDWPTGGYNTFTPLMFTFTCVVLVVCIDVSTTPSVPNYLSWICLDTYVSRLIFVLDTSASRQIQDK